MSQQNVKTYLQIAFEVLEKMKADGKWTKEHEEGILSFAKYLDSFQDLTKELAILAYQKTAQINREIILALAEKLPKETVENVVRAVTAKHKHKKKLTVSDGTKIGD